MLKILVVNDVFPHINNRTTILFKNIIPILSKKFEIKVYWLITDDYGIRYKKTNPNYEVLFMSDFKNAIEVIEKVKPNIIYHLIGWHVVDYAFIIAKEFLKISSVGYADDVEKNDYFDETTSKIKFIKEYLKQSIEFRKLNDNKNKSRAKNFIKKNLFLFNTIKTVKKTWWETIIIFINFIRTNKGQHKNDRYLKFNADLILAENSRQIESLVKWGLEREKIVIVGNSTFDRPIIESNKPHLKLNDKINILFITTNISGVQGKSKWSKSKRNEMIKELAKKLGSTPEKISLTVKIHPTSENYSEYKKILEPYQNVHLAQTQDIVDLLVKSDLVITPNTTTAGVIALIMKKPIIIWNYFQVQGDLFLKKGVALECKTSSNLYESVNTVKSFNLQNKKKIDTLVKEQVGEGNSAQRCVLELEKWLKNLNIEK